LKSALLDIVLKTISLCSGTNGKSKRLLRAPLPPGCSLTDAGVKTINYIGLFRNVCFVDFVALF
jgi:hypothetical protein